MLGGLTSRLQHLASQALTEFALLRVLQGLLISSCLDVSVGMAVRMGAAIPNMPRGEIVGDSSRLPM
jgi:hypothetical protein